jgi:hypothetical protein
MSNPYAPPRVDRELGVVVKPSFRYAMGSLVIAVAWWAALLVPDVSRDFLIGSDTQLFFLDASQSSQPVLKLIAFVRVVVIVWTACLSFRRLRRAWPKLTWLTAASLLYAGSALFVLTAMPRFELEQVVTLAVIGPPMFVVFAWYVVLPMTVLTALALARLDRA